MIVYLKGTLEKLKADSIILEVAGVGYEVYMPTAMIANCPTKGNDLKIHTYHYVREDNEVLYGFLAEEDLEVFKKLITVNGIGPKGALSILSTISVDDLKYAIMTEDDSIIAKTPGIGKKTAQRLIIDLKDKLNLDGFDIKLDSLSNSADLSNQAGSRQEALEALVALGYTSHEALQVLKKITAYKDVEDLIKQALKAMAII